MKLRIDDPSKLSDFKALSFDCFGTLVDWESGIYEELKPLLARLPPSHALRTNKDLATKAYDNIEVSLCASNPTLKYPALLSQAYLNLASSLSLPPPPQSEADALAASISKWPAFPDTIAALKRLQKHYKLVILSNVDRESFSHVLSGALAAVSFDAVYVAEEIGSYKPDVRNFEYLLRRVKAELGVEKGEVLHTAHGIDSDHVPAGEMGMAGAWIARGKSASEERGMGKGGGGTAVFTWWFEDLEGLADVADEAFGGE